LLRLSIEVLRDIAGGLGAEASAAADSDDDRARWRRVATIV